jgi:ADP-heptose:LPS heptosyltransferase
VKSKKIIISRTDSIGDVLLTLPLTGVIKENLSDSIIVFLASKYTQPVLRNSKYIDEFCVWEEVHDKREEFQKINADVIIHVFPRKEIASLARAIGIKKRIGTSHRVYHWWTCNSLVNIGRKNSNLHEAQLNLKLLESLKITREYSLNDLSKFCGWKHVTHIPKHFSPFIVSEKFNLIFHMMSKGNAKHWPLLSYFELATQLAKEKYNILVTGTKEEGKIIANEVPEIFSLSHVQDVTGKFSLDEFITFIQCSDGLLSGSTGPLHIAAISGKYALGLYPSRRPMHALRWAPIGVKADYISEEDNTESHLKISITSVKDKIIGWLDY